MRRAEQTRERTHFKEGGPYIYWTACGLIGSPSHGASFDAREVTCLNCQRTATYRNALLEQDTRR